MSGGPATKLRGSVSLPPLTPGPHRRRLGLVATVATLGGLLFGYDTGVANGAERPLQHEMGLNDIQIGVVISSLVFAAALGAMLSGRLADKIGRRKTIILLSVLFFLGTLIVITAPTGPDGYGSHTTFGYAVLIAGRICLGIAVGGASAVVPVYLSELAPYEIRGSLSGRNELMIVVGQLAAFVVNAIIAAIMGLGTPGLWRVMFAICAVPAVFLFFGMLRMPESPRWLVEKGRHEDARAVLLTVRSEERAEAELADVEHLAQDEREQGGQVGLKTVLRNRSLLAVLLIACGLGIAQQFTGVNAIMYYGQRMLAESGFSDDMIGWVNIAPGVIAVIGGIIALTLMDRINRRTNFLWGYGMTAISHILIAVAMVFVFPEGSAARPWAFLVLIVIMIGSIQLFLNLATWVYLSEIFPLHMRGIGMGLSVFVLWVANGILATFVPAIVGAVGMGLFALFAVVNVISFLFILKFVPETRGRTLEELEDDVVTGAILLPSGPKAGRK